MLHHARIPLAAGIAILLLFFGSVSTAAEIVLPNADLALGAPGQVEAWTLSGGSGTVQDEGPSSGLRALVVQGTGNDTNEWRTPTLPFEPNAVYSLRFKARRLASGTGPLISGTPFCNRDYGDMGTTWELARNIIAVPSELPEGTSYLRFGQWHANSPCAFGDFHLRRALPMYSAAADVVLGLGERVEGNQYHYFLPCGATSNNQTRAIASFHCAFNSNRYVFGRGSEIVFEHGVGDRAIQSATLSADLTYFIRGKMEVEVSADGSPWRPLAATTSNRLKKVAIPAELLPAKRIRIRIADRSGEPLTYNSDLGSFALGNYLFDAKFDGPPMTAVGSTEYLEVERMDPNFEVTVESMSGLWPGGDGWIALRAINKTAKAVRVTAYVEEYGQEGRAARNKKVKVTLQPGATTVKLPVAMRQTGPRTLRVNMGDVFEGACELEVSAIHDDSYGERLTSANATLGLWWANSGWKVSKTRAVPEAKGRAVQLRLACNEAEAAQLVLHPHETLRQVRVSASALRGPDGATLPAESVQVLKVAYVNIEYPTDRLAAPGLWPDPLPPIDGPFDVDADTNQPLWVRVKTPVDAVPGVYRGAITIEAEGGYRAEAPLEVEVYGFNLPDRMTCTTAFGLNLRTVWQYHNVTTDADKRTVMSKYLQCMADHHLSPYNPSQMDAMAVTWPKPEQGGEPAAWKVSIDFTAWDAAMEKAFDYYHFTSMNLTPIGMGGGTYQGTKEPSLLGFGKDTPEFKALFTQYWSQIQEHLREKGWLDEAYVYWFDEPEPHQYGFVNEGFQRLKQAAPDIQGMLTEQPEPELVGGPKIWCPITPAYQQDSADARRALGETFWWYVCTVPREPYPGLFIDHPGTDLRVWLWQTWQRKINGVLVWATVQWTSDKAYPNPKRPQNPYEDPMSWISDASIPVGARVPWGNGDGRFMYPPLAAADGPPAAPVLEGPVESFRLEMLRDGIEDYEYFVILKHLLTERGAALPEKKRQAYEALLEVPAEVSTTATEYTKSPAPMEKRRDEIARAIAALQQGNSAAE